MWLIGVIILLLIGSGTCLLIGRQPLDQPSTGIWDIAGTARTYTTIVGTLAGFSVTSSIFIANLSVARQSAAFEGIMALFLIAFLIFISAAIQFGTTPNLPQHPSDIYETIQGYSYLLANASFYLGLSLSWLGLPLLLSAIGLEYLSKIMIWLVLFAILGGAARLCGAGLNAFARAELRVTFALPPICFAIAACYRLLLGEQFEDLLPTEHEPALFAVVCFALAALGFGLQSTGIAWLRQNLAPATLAAVGDRVLLAYMAGVVTATSLLWLAIAKALHD